MRLYTVLKGESHESFDEIRPWGIDPGVNKIHKILKP
jgi:hypothetical protein